MDAQALVLSLKLATLSTLILLAIGLPFSYWLAFSERKPKSLAEAAIALPLVLPPTVLGFYLLLLMSGPVGGVYESLFNATLAFSFTGILIASVLHSLPFAINPFTAAFSQVDKDLIHASWSLGESRLGTFRRIILPLSYPGILRGVVLTFAHSLGEFGVILMIGGNIEGATRTLSIAIYDDVQALNYESAAQTSAFFLVLSFSILAFAFLFRRKKEVPWTSPSS